MDRLTREEIERKRDFLNAAIALLEGMSQQWMDERWRASNDLCDLALQSLSQEAVRDEALEELAAGNGVYYVAQERAMASGISEKWPGVIQHPTNANGRLVKREFNSQTSAVLEEIMQEVQRAAVKFPTWPTDPLHALAVLGEEFGELTKAMLQLIYEPDKTSKEEVCKEALQTAAMAYRLYASLGHYDYKRGPQHEQTALKREPNAAGQAGQRNDSAPSQEGHAAGPAPAAPDVASMVKRLNDISEGREGRIAHIFKDCREAAALLAKLGQGWIPVSERLPQDDTSPVLVNYRAAFHTRKFASGKAKRHRVMFAIFSGGKWRFTLKHEKTRLSERVTHWMPLPPAPGASDD